MGDDKQIHKKKKRRGKGKAEGTARQPWQKQLDENGQLTNG